MQLAGFEVPGGEDEEDKDILLMRHGESLFRCLVDADEDRPLRDFVRQVYAKAASGDLDKADYFVDSVSIKDRDPYVLSPVLSGQTMLLQVRRYSVADNEVKPEIAQYRIQFPNPPAASRVQKVMFLDYPQSSGADFAVFSGDTMYRIYVQRDSDASFEAEAQPIGQSETLDMMRFGPNRVISYGRRWVYDASTGKTYDFSDYFEDDVRIQDIYMTNNVEQSDNLYVRDTRGDVHRYGVDGNSTFTELKLDGESMTGFKARKSEDVVFLISPDYNKIYVNDK